MKKGVHVVLLVVGIILMLATESENAATNIIGLLLVGYECNNLNLFGYDRKTY